MNYACTNSECTMGRVPDRSSVNGHTRCPSCCGKGYISCSLPVPDELKLVSSDLGFTKPRSWRPLDVIGSIRGLPVSGKAIATDGVLVILQRDNGGEFIGHLENFVKEKQKSNRAKGKKVDVNEGLWD